MAVSFQWHGGSSPRIIRSTHSTYEERGKVDRRIRERNTCKDLQTRRCANPAFQSRRTRSSSPETRSNRTARNLWTTGETATAVNTLAPRNPTPGPPATKTAANPAVESAGSSQWTCCRGRLVAAASAQFLDDQLNFFQYLRARHSSSQGGVG